LPRKPSRWKWARCTTCSAWTAGEYAGRRARTIPTRTPTATIGWTTLAITTAQCAYDQRTWRWWNERALLPRLWHAGKALCLRACTAVVRGQLRGQGGRHP